MGGVHYNFVRKYLGLPCNMDPKRSPTKIPSKTVRNRNANPKIPRVRGMQKREQGKSGGSAGGGAAPPAKRGRPFGSGSSSASASASAADSAAPSTLLGPSLHVHNSFAGQFTASSLSMNLYTHNWFYIFSSKIVFCFNVSEFTQHTHSCTNNHILNFNKQFFLLLMT